MQYTLLPEWAEQDAIMLTWPHADTDWSSILDKVEPIYILLCEYITQVQDVVIIAHNIDIKSRIESKLKLHKIDINKVHFVIAPCNDTWARDHGPISTVSADGHISMKDFQFNGWGNKYAHEFDNEISKLLFENLSSKDNNYKKIDIVLEGGGIEINEHGTLLTTTQCLLNKNRNPHLNKNELEQILSKELGTEHFLWLDHGYLEGDDTDSHIDTLVRFAPNNTLVYVKCDDKDDEHFTALNNMESQLAQFKTKDNKPFKLISLPWPKAIYNEQGDRLPATYANFLVLNKTVLVPIYDDENDTYAIQSLQCAYPEHTVIGIDCIPIIQQFGSLHCLTMQLPSGFLKRS